MSADDQQASLDAFAAPAWQPASDGAPTHRECRNCGRFVSARYRRFHGDEQGRVHRCPACSTQTERFHGLATDPEKSVDYTTGAGGGRR